MQFILDGCDIFFARMRCMIWNPENVIFGIILSIHMRAENVTYCRSPLDRIFLKTPMLLTIDAGNTRTKWAIFNRDGEISHTGACGNDCLPEFELSLKSQVFKRVIISNVAGKVHAERLAHLLAQQNLPVTWVKSAHESCGVINRYLEVETLGTDRWAALVAAWHQHQAPCVVVNAGTAVTIDALVIHRENNQHGEFVGGMILPGISLMLTSLGQSTAQLPKLDPYNTHDLNENVAMEFFAKTTAQAIHSGTLHAITGAIAQMTKALETKSGQIPYIILSGGDAPVIQSGLTNTISNPNLIIDHLVLKGLYLMDRSKP